MRTRHALRGAEGRGRAACASTVREARRAARSSTPTRCWSRSGAARSRRTSASRRRASRSTRRASSRSTRASRTQRADASRAIGDLAGAPLLAHKASRGGHRRRRVRWPASRARALDPQHDPRLHLLPAAGRVDRPHRGRGARALRRRPARRALPVHRVGQGGRRRATRPASRRSSPSRATAQIVGAHLVGHGRDRADRRDRRSRMTLEATTGEIAAHLPRAPDALGGDPRSRARRRRAAAINF